LRFESRSLPYFFANRSLRRTEPKLRVRAVAKRLGHRATTPAAIRHGYPPRSVVIFARTRPDASGLGATDPISTSLKVIAIALTAV
jgi:hypothetical protein